MNRLNRVGKNDHSFQGEALFRQGREKGATPRQKFIRETLVSEVGKNRVNRVERKGVNKMEAINRDDIHAQAFKEFNEFRKSDTNYNERMALIHLLASIEMSLIEIRNELRRQNNGKT